MEFEWDYKKAKENLEKHKVSFEQAIETFSDPEGILLEDYQHSLKEKRFFWIGKTFDDQILTSRFTLRGEVIRIIGCANWRKFRKYYETTKVK